MSDIIRLLPDSVANQIAAGEVVQRPSSVIKELVENAIDAEATTIHVIIVDAGRTSIQVIDNGKGMSETDARLAFDRHATSKIRQAADLFALQTMGFRGEALASIAAVAQVELQTRQESQEVGTKITLSGSTVTSQESVSCPVGCNFTVRNLFFNVPARRKFLKSNQAESTHIVAEFEHIALVHPELAFTLHLNEVEVFNLPASGIRQRILNILGKSLNQQLLSIEVDTNLVSISGFVCKPEYSRKRGTNQYFFVNGRYMRHPYFHKAVLHAYEQLIPIGEQPSYFIYLEVAPDQIDVNIHPTKTEIKFEHEQGIWQIIASCVKESLGKFNAVPSIDFDTEGMPLIPVFDKNRAVAPPTIHFNPHYNPFEKQSTNHTSKASLNWGQSTLDSSPRIPTTADFESTTEWIESESAPTQQILSSAQTPLFEEKSNSHLPYKGRYIVTSVKSGLMLIDHHRAHTRVLFDDYIYKIRNHKGSSQGVLFPEIVELSTSEVITMQAIQKELQLVGFEITNLGGNSYAINGVPSDIEGIDYAKLLRNMIHTAQEKGCDVKEELQETIALTLARTAAIPYGQLLTTKEIDALIGSLFSCATPNYTPDGKSILTLLGDDEIERRFK